MGDKEGVKGMVQKVKAEEKDILSVIKMVDPIRELGSMWNNDSTTLY